MRVYEDGLNSTDRESLLTRSARLELDGRLDGLEVLPVRDGPPVEEQGRRASNTQPFAEDAVRRDYVGVLVAAQAGIERLIYQIDSHRIAEPQHKRLKDRHPFLCDIA